MIMFAWGRGVTVCGFCRKRVDYVLEGNRAFLDGKEVGLGMPLFCSVECEEGWKMGLDAKVNI